MTSFVIEDSAVETIVRCCANCLAFRPQREPAGDGNCIRRPPQLVGITSPIGRLGPQLQIVPNPVGGIVTCFPAVKAEQCCLDHVPNPDILAGPRNAQAGDPAGN